MSEQMAVAAAEVTFTLKVLVKKEIEKVLFAEVDSDFADILISFITLPLGTIVRLLINHYGDDAPVIGSLNTLYKGLENLDVSNFWTKIGKQMLLNPKNSCAAHLQKLKVNMDDTEPTKYFICGNGSCTKDKRVAMYPDMEKCTCGSSINKEIRLNATTLNNVGPGIFTTGISSFIVTDDLQLLPNFVGEGLQILSNIGIKGTDGVEVKTVSVGYEEIMELLKLSLVSRTPLTDFIYHKIQTRAPITVIGNIATSNYKKMTVKAIVQKSTCKILLLQTNEDFIDFLFSLLTIPLGKAFSLLGGNVSVGSIDNLYRSLGSLKLNCYLKPGAFYNTTMLPPKYLSEHQIFPLTQQINEDPLYCYSGYLTAEGPGAYASWRQRQCYVSAVLLDPKGRTTYIKGPSMFIVTNELVVKPVSAISGISIINSLGIPVSDIEEHVVAIGLEEALNILKASLCSNSILNDSLKPFLKR